MNISNKNKNYRRDNGLISSCQYHVIWCPKYRRRVLTNGIDLRMKELILSNQSNIGYDILELEIMPDHVHLLLDCSAKKSIYSIVSQLKGLTSRILREEFPELKKKLPSLWSRSKFISTVGEVSLQTVKQYIEDQKKQ